MQIMQPYQTVLAANEGKRLSRLKRETLLLTNDFDEEDQTYHLKVLHCQVLPGSIQQLKSNAQEMKWSSCV